MRTAGFIISTLTSLSALGMQADLPASDQAPRWKWEVGQRLNYQLQSASRVTISDSGVVFALDQQLDLTWQVEEVSDENVATMRQSIDRVRLRLSNPLHDLAFDSAREEDPQGVAALAGPVFAVILEEPLHFRLSARGAVSELQIPQAIQEAMADSPLSAALKPFASEDGLRQLLLFGIPELPDQELESEDEWTTNLGESTNQSFGRQQVSIKYRHAGAKEQQGDRLAVFSAAPEIQFTNDGENPPESIEQQATGEVLFNITQGRLEESRWEIKLDVVLTSGTGRLEQTFSFAWVEDDNDAEDNAEVADTVETAAEDNEDAETEAEDDEL